MAISDLTGTTWRIKDEQPTYLAGNYSITGTITCDGGDHTYPQPIIEIIGGNFYMTGVGDHIEYNSGDAAWEEDDTEAIVENIVVSFTGGTDATNSTLISWIDAIATQVSNNPQFTIDLTTLTNYSTIFPTEGNYTITVKAEANNYNDSIASNSETYTKAASGYDLTLNFIANQYYGVDENGLNFKINATPSSAADIDYILNTPWAGSPGDFRENAETQDLVNLHYDEGGTYTIHNVTSVTYWADYNDDANAIYINSTSVEAPVWQDRVTVTLSANTTINIYYDYDM